MSDYYWELPSDHVTRLNVTLLDVDIIHRWVLLDPTPAFIRVMHFTQRTLLKLP